MESLRAKHPPARRGSAYWRVVLRKVLSRELRAAMLLKFAFAQTAGRTVRPAVSESAAVGDSILDSRRSQSRAASSATSGPNRLIVCAIRFGRRRPNLTAMKK